MKRVLSFLTLAFFASAVSVHGVESVPGVRGNAARIDGSVEFLQDSTFKRFDFKKGMSVSFWVKGYKWSQEAGIISGLGDTRISKRYATPEGSFYFNSMIGGKKAALLWAPKCFTAPLNKWVNIAFTYDTEKRISKAYFNGKECAVWDIGKEYPGRKFYEMSGRVPRGIPFAVGKADKSNFEGEIDELFIYNRPLSNEEMAQVSSGKILPGVQAAYLFDDASDIGKDLSPAKRHLKKTPGPKSVKLPPIGKSVKAPVLALDGSLAVWSRSAVEKTFQYDRVVPSGVTTAPAAELAKNEFESFQLILSPKKELKNVKVALSSFSFKGHTLAARLQQVGYVNVMETSRLALTRPGTVMGEAATMFENNINDGKGAYPDPIYSAKPLAKAETSRSYAYWVTVKSTPATPAGIYTATATITADGNYRKSVPLKVRVRDFALPQEFSSHNSAIMGYRVSADNREAFHKIASEHHVTLCSLAKEPVITFDAKGNMKVDTTDFDREAEMAFKKYRANTLYFPGWNFYQLPRDYNIRATWYGVPISRTPGKLTDEFKEKFGRYLEFMTAHLKKKGWLKYTRISGVDEPHSAADYALCQEFARLVRRHAPGVKVIITKWPLKPLIGAPDIWCLGMIIPQDIKAAVARGESFEWYPNWHFVIDRPLMDSRMLGFMMYKYNINGILYFNMTHNWENPLRLGQCPTYTYSNGRLINGLGQIFYPPEVKGGEVVSSLRLVMCRDAYEDYEYFLLANKLIGKCKDPARAAAAKKLLKEAGDAIVPAYEAYADKTQWKKTKWETDGSKLLVWRQKIADLIETLQK